MMDKFDQQKALERYNKLCEERFYQRRVNHYQDALREQELNHLCREASQHGFVFASPENEDPQAEWLHLTHQQYSPRILRPLTETEAEEYQSLPEEYWEQPLSLRLKESLEEIIASYPSEKRQEATRFLKAIIKYLERSESKRLQALSKRQGA